MRSHSVCKLALALLVLSLADCSSARQPTSDYLKDTWGIQLSDFSGDFEVDTEGTQIHTSTGRITVDGLGTSEISVQTTVQPVAQGGETTLYVYHLDGSQERYFVYDQVHDDIEFGTPTQGVAVGRNPDGTYQVWAYDNANKDQELQVQNGFEALKVVEQYNEYKTISPYIFLTAFAVAHTSAPEARSVINCLADNTADAPVVCDLFKEFCDCAACLVLKRQGACGLCPKL